MATHVCRRTVMRSIRDLYRAAAAEPRPIMARLFWPAERANRFEGPPRIDEQQTPVSHCADGITYIIGVDRQYHR